MHVALLSQKEKGREKKEEGGEGVMPCGQVPVMMMVPLLLWPWFC